MERAYLIPFVAVIACLSRAQQLLRPRRPSLPPPLPAPRPRLPTAAGATHLYLLSHWKRQSTSTVSTPLTVLGVVRFQRYGSDIAPVPFDVPLTCILLFCESTWTLLLLTHYSLILFFLCCSQAPRLHPGSAQDASCIDTINHLCHHTIPPRRAPHTY